MSNIEVRDLNLSDEKELLKVAELFVAVPLSWDPTYKYTNETVVKTRDWMLEKRDSLKCLLATANENFVGLHLLRIDAPGAEHCFIQSLWIEEAFRGQGLGSRLKLVGEDWAKSKDVKKMVTHVFLDNPKMIAINEAKGFKKVKVELHKTL